MPNKTSTVCFLTSGRMDFGLISPVVRELEKFPELDIHLIAMGAHLSPYFGGYEHIKDISGIKITKALKTLSEDDSDAGVAQTIANTSDKIGEALSDLKPDAIVIAGDRYEMLACAGIATVLNIPIIHLYGGDISYGAYDDNIRHAISKLSHLHFVSNDEARNRVLQLGENPKTVFNFGAPALSYLDSFTPTIKEDLAEDLEIQFGARNIMVTYHPATRGGDDVDEFIGALRALSSQANIFVTMPNADNAGRALNAQLEELSKEHKNIWLFKNLGVQRYLSLMSYVDLVLGNSSSGLYEAPSFKIPTVNVGDRQKGRLAPASVLSVRCKQDDIVETVLKAFTFSCEHVKNHYHQKDAARNIAKTIYHFAPFTNLLNKEFFTFA